MKLTLPESAFFEVDRDSEMSEGRGPLRGIGRFLGYWDAPATALGQAAHGRFGIMSIVVPYQQDDRLGQNACGPVDQHGLPLDVDQRPNRGAVRSGRGLSAWPRLNLSMAIDLDTWF